MPYISKEHQDLFDEFVMYHVDGTFRNLLEAVEDCTKKLPVNKRKGFLNYVLSRIALSQLKGNGISYQNISDVIAALNDAAEEIRRRVLNPYEDKAIEVNGDLPAYKEL